MPYYFGDLKGDPILENYPSAFFKGGFVTGYVGLMGFAKGSDQRVSSGVLGGST